MTLRENTFYFQKLSFFLHRLVPNEDFSVNVKRFIEYKINKKTAIAVLYFYDKEGRFLPVMYQIGTPNTFSTEENISRILKELEEKYGLKMEDEDYGKEEPDTEGEGSN